MRFFHAALMLSVVCALAGMAATTPAKTTTPKTTKAVANKSATKSTTKKTAVSTAKSKSVKVKKTTTAPVASWRTHQQNPTADRYREIQQALVTKGYLKSEPTGVWDADSISALQRFQMDQKLTPTGKINAPSLIGLGLGAKSAGASEAAPLPSAPAPVQPTPETTSPPPTTAP